MLLISCTRQLHSLHIYTHSLYIDYIFSAHVSILLSSFWTTAVVTGRGVVPFIPRGSCLHHLSRIRFRFQQSYDCSSNFHLMWLTHALALSASQFVRKKKSPRVYTSDHGLDYASYCENNNNNNKNALREIRTDETDLLFPFFFAHF